MELIFENLTEYSAFFIDEDWTMRRIAKEINNLCSQYLKYAAPKQAVCAVIIEDDKVLAVARRGTLDQWGFQVEK